MTPLRKRIVALAPVHKTVNAVLTDVDLAKLGDAYTNLVYSLYLSIRTGKPTGRKTEGNILSEALKQAGLKLFLPSRMDRHGLADAAESLLVYVWLTGLMTLGESVSLMAKHRDAVDAFDSLLSVALKRLESFL
ncbi:hypothetical protein KAH85_04045 [Candidatus Bathyarchaeota archaeon]|nr:hypothetical protein [Candidatus Bathyarchaeota archaeon]